MTDTLREHLTELILPIVRVSLSESEEGNYPYCTYDMTTEPTYAKDGIVRFMGSTNIYIISKDFAEADGIRSDVEAAIQEGFRSQKWGHKLISTDKTRLEGVWTINLNYNLIQKI